MAFQGSSDKLITPQNGKFFGLIQMLAKFDPVIQKHLALATKGSTSDHYCGKNIKNELIDLMSQKVNGEIINRVLKAVYYSIIANCTPGIFRKKQLSLITRIVDLSLNIRVEIKEYFLALYVPCGSHNLNLVISDSVWSSVKSIVLFGTLQRLFTLFSASVSQWKSLIDHAKILHLKKLCDTRWEAKISSAKAVCYQVGDIHDALIALSEIEGCDPETAHKTITLAEQFKDFSFLISLIVWLDIRWVNLSFKNCDINEPFLRFLDATVAIDLGLTKQMRLTASGLKKFMQNI
nr:unnamed protein product [Hydra vulgaris]